MGGDVTASESDTLRMSLRELGEVMAGLTPSFTDRGGSEWYLGGFLSAWMRGLARDVDRITLLDPLMVNEADDPTGAVEDTCWRLSSAVDKVVYLTCLVVGQGVLEVSRSSGSRELRLRKAALLRRGVEKKLREMRLEHPDAGALSQLLHDWSDSSAARLRNSIAHEMASMGTQTGLAPFEAMLDGRAPEVRGLAPHDMPSDPFLHAELLWADYLGSVRQGTAALGKMLRCVAALVAENGVHMPLPRLLLETRPSGRRVIKELTHEDRRT